MVVRHTEHDREIEREVAKIVGEKFGVDCRVNDAFDPLDFTLYKDDEIVGYCELKTRSNLSTKYDTVYLSYRKFIELGTGSLYGFFCLFIVNFVDKILAIDVDDVDASRTIMGGRTDRSNAPNDIEKLIEVPIKDMFLIKEKNG